MRPDPRAMRPVPVPESPSLIAQGITVLLTPIAYAVALVSWAASTVLQLPVRLLIRSLQLLDGLINDVLAFLTKQPGAKTQIHLFQRTVTSLQHNNQAQHRQILLLQNELDGLRLEKSKTQRKNNDLSKQLSALQQRVTELQASSQVGGPPSPSKAAAARRPAAGAAPHDGEPQYAPDAVPHVTYDTKRWYLHACVALAALGVRWWLLHQTDPLQRKVMLVVIWPAVWIYGAMVFNCLPHSSTLRAALACFCWALLGYIGHEVVAFSVRGQQQQLIHPGAAAPSLHSMSSLSGSMQQWSAAGRAA